MKFVLSTATKNKHGEESLFYVVCSLKQKSSAAHLADTYRKASAWETEIKTTYDTSIRPLVLSLTRILAQP